MAFGAFRCNSFSAPPKLIASGRKYKSGVPLSNSTSTSASADCDASDGAFNRPFNGIQSAIRIDLIPRDFPANQRCLGRYSGSSNVSRRRRPSPSRRLSHPAVTFNGECSFKSALTPAGVPLPCSSSQRKLQGALVSRCKERAEIVYRPVPRVGVHVVGNIIAIVFKG